MKEIFITVIEDKIIGYTNLKLLCATIGSPNKYWTVRRKLHIENEYTLEGVIIKKIPFVRGTRNHK